MRIFSKLVITLALALSVCPQPLRAQMLQSPVLNSQVFDNTGRPAASGRLYFCSAGSSCPGTPIPSFSSSSGFSANPNPLILDSLGHYSVWLSPGIPYKIVCTTSVGAVINGCGGDNIIGAAAGSSGGGGGGGGGGSTTPGGASTNVQYNLSGAFAGDGNFTWASSTRQLTVTSTPGTIGILSAGGFVTSTGGFFSAVPGGSWQGFNSTSDGAALRGLNVGQNTANNAGGYINLGPLTYNPYNGAGCLDVDGNRVRQPLPLNGLSNFGTHTAVLWVGESPLMPATGCGGAPLPVDLDFGLNLNMYFFARGGLATDQPFYNAINTIYSGGGIPAGGVEAGSLTAGTLYPVGTVTTAGTLSVATYLGGYVNTGHSSGPPAAGTIATVTNPIITNGGVNAGTIYWDDNDHCEKVFSDPAATPPSAWACLAGGGGGSTPGGATTQVQYNNAGSLAGSANFTWDNANHLLNVIAVDSAHAGINVQTGFIASDKGFLASGTATNYNAIQAPSGGMYALSFSALNYIQSGNSNGIPALTTGDTFNRGALYCDTGTTPCVEKLWNGSAWVTLATGGATSPGGANTNVQFNSAGSFGGSANLTYATQLLNSIAASSAVSGMNVQTGFMSADQGFIANSGICIKYNCIQAPTGGEAALSGTFVNYMQPGSFSSGGGGGTPTLTNSDTFHPGAISWDTFGSGALKFYNGTSWVAFSSGGGSPGAPTTSIQFNNSGVFGGTANMIWDGAKIVVTNASVVAGMYCSTCFIQSDGGFLATIGTATLYNSIQAPGGGMAAKSFSATRYIQTGNNNGIPALTTGDAFHAGAQYWDTGSNLGKIFDGSTWQTIVTGAGTIVSSITGTANEVIASASTGNITLSTPQAIGTSSSPTFANVTATTAFNVLTGGQSQVQANFTGSGGRLVVNTTGGTTVASIGASTGFQTAALPIQTYTAGFGALVNNLTTAGMTTTGAFNSTASGAAIAFQGNSFQVDGNGNISGNGSLNMNGGTGLGVIRAGGTIKITSLGELVNRAVSGTPSCAGLADGLMIYDTFGNHLWICNGGVAQSH